MHCDNCGKFNASDSVFCGGCGKRIEKEKNKESNSNYNYNYSSSNLVKNESGLFKVLVTVSLIIIILLASILIWRFVYLNKEEAKIHNTEEYSQDEYEIKVQEYNEDMSHDTEVNLPSQDNHGINSINTGPGTTNNHLENNVNNTTYNNETINNTTSTTKNNIDISEVNTEYNINNGNINY